MGKIVATAVISLTVVGYLGARNPPHTIDPTGGAIPEKKNLGLRDCRITSATEVLSLANSSKSMVAHMARAIAIIDTRATTLMNGIAIDSYIPGELEVCGVVITTTYKNALLTFKRSIDNEGRERAFILAGVDFPGDYPLLNPSDIPILQNPRSCRGNLEWGTARICTNKEAGWILPEAVNIKY